MRTLFGKLSIDQVRDDLPQVLNRGVFHIQQESISARELEDLIHIPDPHRNVILVREEVLHYECWRPCRYEHLAVERVTHPLRGILDVILVYYVRRVLLLRANDLACDLVVVPMKGLPEDFAADRVQLRHKVGSEEPQVILL